MCPFLDLQNSWKICIESIYANGDGKLINYPIFPPCSRKRDRLAVIVGSCEPRRVDGGIHSFKLISRQLVAPATLPFWP